MKKLFQNELVGILLIVAGSLMFLVAAAPLTRNFYSATGDVSLTTDYVHDGTWKCLDSMIVVASDSAATIISISGVAVMDPIDQLWIGLGNDSANQITATNTAPNSNLDTFKVTRDYTGKNQARVPFCFRYVNKTNGANTDTFFWNAAVGGTGDVEGVSLEDVVVSASVADQ